MNKYFLFLLTAFFLFVSLQFEAVTAAQPSGKIFVNQTPTPESKVKIEKLELDRSEIFIPCSNGKQPKDGAVCDETNSVKVKTTVSNPENTLISYQYQISGGRIIGTGESVVWDLSGVRPGTYTVTVWIDAGEQTKTERIEVKDCHCTFIDACPAISVTTSKNTIKAGETIIFKAEIKGVATENIFYNWTISQGEIIEGQGTAQIKVKTRREMAGVNLTATVEINHDRSSFCETTASETISISGR